MEIRFGQSLAINGVTADFGNETLRDREGNPVDLRPQAFAVLRYLAQNADRLVTKDELIEAVWLGIAVTEDSLFQCIHEIRRALHDEARTILQTAPKRGYRLVLSVNGEKRPAGLAAAGFVESSLEAAAPIPEAMAARRSRKPLRASLVVTIVAALGIIGATIWHIRPSQRTLEGIPSIAVLPFHVIDSDETTKRFASGIGQDIITDLSRYRDIEVIGWNSSSPYAGAPVDVRKIGRDLNVRYVLKGSVQRAQDQIRVTTELLDTATAVSLWSERWDRPVVDLFAVQAEISNAVTSQLGSSKGAIPEADRIAGLRLQPQNLTAYETYLRGRESLLRFTKQSIEASIPLFRQAVTLDPKLARAWIEMASAYNTLAGFGANNDEVLPQALAAAETGLAIDPQDALAHAIMALVLGHMDDFERAEAEFDIALRLNPGSADIMTLYSLWANAFGKPERGAEAADKAIRLNPNYPNWAALGFRYAYFMAGRYEDALHVLERLPLENYNSFSWIVRAAVYVELGRDGEARTWVAKGLAKYPELTIEGFVNGPGWSASERKRIMDAMQRAGFPPCALPDQLNGVASPIRIPECVNSKDRRPSAL
ncbi:winged helix-turn-helix domain-containing protein [Mesorhizobium helmanticense]|uniref:Adenylate/guanylate cyclase domain-containing protein n=1 Tax=Mesorhizobium helmanticense TaxID=1776423 RepID=A0A2T4J394_9HYPH|nr:winged helix-turn-helix domain-containing protein [Mesorhizobium helmanticense]PTE12374.1 adenylate/guanylate cyclase domain-containing protein [Mesorhizobium helmanticense]